MKSDFTRKGCTKSGTLSATKMAQIHERFKRAVEYGAVQLPVHYYVKTASRFRLKLLYYVIFAYYEMQ